MIQSDSASLLSLWVQSLVFLLWLCDYVHSQSSSAATIDGDSRLSTFSAQLDRAGISPTIALTIFAPTNGAYNRFQSANPDLWIKYTQQVEYLVHFRDLHLWHFVTEAGYTVNDIFDGRRQTLETQLGNITVTQTPRSLDNVPGTAIIQSDIETIGGGFIHVIDDIILPPYLGMNLVENLLRDRHFDFAFTTMANIALWARLDDELNMVYENGITFLVPPNRRFVRAQIDVPRMLTEEMREYTRDFVLSHMIEQNYDEEGIFTLNAEQDREQFLVTSMLGTHMWITTTENKVRFQSTDVLLFDQPSAYGIYHGLDFPLKPPFASDFAFFTSLSTSWDTTDCFRFFRQTLLSSEDISNMFDSTITLWCPTTEAFEFFNNRDFNRLLEPIWVRHATEFLLNHMSAPAISRQEFVNNAPGLITMLNGATYEARKSGTRPRIRSGPIQARSDFGDLISVDGYMHLLDTVITPTAVSRSIYDQSQDNPDFSLLVKNIDFVDLTNIVDQDLPLTLLAPNDAAFRRVQFGALDGAEIILRHLFRGLLFTDVIANETQITAVNGVTLGVDLRGAFNESLFVGGAYVYQGDILARNGVLHYVDRVIGVPYDTSAPTLSPAPTITATPTAMPVPTQAPVPTPSGTFPFVLPPVNTNPPVEAPVNAPTTPASPASKLYSGLLISYLIALAVVQLVN